jgi:hypothetical protein
MRRRVATFLGAVVGAALLVAPAGAAPAPGAHPHFNDGGTLRWHTTFAAAARAARDEGRLVFMDMGRHVCAPCETLVSRVLPDPYVRARLQRVAVGLAVDADHPEAFIDALRRRELPHEIMLPMTAFLTPEGAWITGASGALDVHGFLVHLARAEAALARRPGPRPSLSRVSAPAPRAPLPREAATLAPPVVRRSASPAPAAARPTAPAALPAPRASSAAPAPKPAEPRPAAPSRPAPSPTPRVEPDDGPRISCCVEHNPAMEGPARRLADQGRWAEALAQARTTRDPALRELEQRAGRWGETELGRGLIEALAGRPASARTLLEGVRRELTGLPGAADAEIGLDALDSMADFAQFSDPRGPLASALRANKREELRGTRWARLFPAA